MNRKQLFLAALYDVLLGLGMFGLFLGSAYLIDRAVHWLHIEDPLVVTLARLVAVGFAAIGAYGALRVAWASMNEMLSLANRRD